MVSPLLKMPQEWGYVGDICNSTKKSRAIFDPAFQTYSNPIIFIVVAAPEATLKEYRNPGMVL
jgi:hypothetical protein